MHAEPESDYHDTPEGSKHSSTTPSIVKISYCKRDDHDTDVNMLQSQDILKRVAQGR